jgi:hypothetical protein
MVLHLDWFEAIRVTKSDCHLLMEDQSVSSYLTSFKIDAFQMDCFFVRPLARILQSSFVVQHMCTSLRRPAVCTPGGQSILAYCQFDFHNLIL